MTQCVIKRNMKFSLRQFLLISTIVWGGSSGVWADDALSYLPYFGPAAGGTAIQVFSNSFKNGFDNSCVVFLGSNPCNNIQLVSAQEIDCAAPAGTGTLALTVNCFDGRSAASSQAFTFYAPLALNVTGGNNLAGTSVTATATGGLPPYRYYAAQDGCASVDETTGAGKILPTCKPTGNWGGWTAFTVQDSTGAQISANYEVKTSLTLDLSQMYLPVNQQREIVAQGGQPPYQYQVVSGPVTVQLAQSGYQYEYVIAGAVAGEFTLRVTDALGQTVVATQQVVDHDFLASTTGYNGPAGRQFAIEGVGQDYMGRTETQYKLLRTRQNHLLFAGQLADYTVVKDQKVFGPSALALIDVNSAKTFNINTYGGASGKTEEFGDAIELSSGKFILAGSIDHSGLLQGDSTRATLVRANVDLTPDTSFSGGQAMVVVQPKLAETITSVVEERSGSLLVALRSYDNGPQTAQFYLVRVSADGKQQDSVFVAPQENTYSKSFLAKLPSGDIMMVVNSVGGARFFKVKDGAALSAQNLIEQTALNNQVKNYTVSYVHTGGNQVVMKMLTGNDADGVLSLVGDGEINPNLGNGKSIFVPQDSKQSVISFTDFAVLSDGKILLESNKAAPIVRLNTDGKVDTTYGTEVINSYQNLNDMMVLSLDEKQIDAVSVQDYNAVFSDLLIQL
jgi:hypothetical protein